MEKYNNSWLNSEGNPVQIPDSYENMTEYFSSIIQAAQIAHVESKLETFGHEDVTVLINSNTESNVRTVSFTIVIENWREHTGGDSSYSRQEFVEYVVNEDSESPDELMHSNGAFFHKLENRFTDIFGGTEFDTPMFRLAGYNSNQARYTGHINLHRYDDD